jgi:hypothetical protein
MDTQNYKKMVRMSALDNVYHAVRRVRSLVGTDIAHMSPDDGRIIARLREDGML